jgi:ABC-type amino acid transport substrate-binding protein
VIARVLVTVVSLFGALPMPARGSNSPDVALNRLLDNARVAVAALGTCTQPGIDRLVRILCAGNIRIGVRDEYPLFSTRTGATRHGYEIDLARAIAQRLGIAVDFVKVKPETRVTMLADGSIDLVIATMGDNTQREIQLRFIRPHYYRSETVLVGPRNLAVADWKDIGHSNVCVTVGNGSNAEIVSRGGRLMLFDDAARLPSLLDDETCTLAAQDDRF